MTRVVFAWELGANLGHLERDLPVAQRLRQLGADVHFVVANVKTAEKLLTPEGFPFSRCPAGLRPRRPPTTPVNFSELLLDAGYHDAEALRAAVSGWLALWKQLTPDVIVTDFAPTAMLSARIAQIPSLPLGSGFTVPPARNPMPAFLAEQPHSDSTLRAADLKLLAALNHVTQAFGQPPIEAVGSLFENPAAQITSFPELDPFGPRTDVQYVGPISAKGQFIRVKWPGTRRLRVFAYLQSTTNGLDAILNALNQPAIEAICAIPGVKASSVEKFATDELRIFPEPVDLNVLLPTPSAVVSYGGAGLVSTALQAGAPLLLFPNFLEQHLTAERATRLGAAIGYRGPPTRDNVETALAALVSKPSFKQAARAFAKKYINYRHEPAINAVAKAIVDGVRRNSGNLTLWP